MPGVVGEGQRKLEKAILNNNENEAVCISTIFH
jgi:hypothetical protein